MQSNTRVAAKVQAVVHPQMKLWCFFLLCSKTEIWQNMCKSALYYLGMFLKQHYLNLNCIFF